MKLVLENCYSSKYEKCYLSIYFDLGYTKKYCKDFKLNDLCEMFNLDYNSIARKSHELDKNEKIILFDFK